MRNLMVMNAILLVCTFAVRAQNGCDIAGIWDHVAKPAKLMVDLSKAEASVYSHDQNAKAIGLVVLKDIKPTANTSHWTATMYSADQDEFVEVQLTSKGCNQLHIDFQGAEVLQLVRQK